MTWDVTLARAEDKLVATAAGSWRLNKSGGSNKLGGLIAFLQARITVANLTDIVRPCVKPLFMGIIGEVPSALLEAQPRTPVRRGTNLLLRAYR